jgi:hypothetical protein
LKQACFVGVEAERASVLVQIAPQQAHVLFGRIVHRKARVNAAAGVVDHADQVQLRTAILQPGMLAGVPLH